MDQLTPTCEHCGDPFIPAQHGQKYCSPRHRRAAEKRRQRRKPLREKLLGGRAQTPDATLTRMPGATGPTGATWRDDPRNFSDFGQVPGDEAWLTPDEIDELTDEAGIYAGQFADDDEHERRNQDFQNKVEQADRWRVPQDVMREWSAYATRHGTAHPAEHEYRIQRGLAVREADWSQGTSRFTRNDSGQSIAEKARASRALNRQYARDQQRPISAQSLAPPPSRMASGESMPSPFHGGRAGSRAYGYQMTDGFSF